MVNAQQAIATLALVASVLLNCGSALAALSDADKKLVAESRPDVPISPPWTSAMFAMSSRARAADVEALEEIVASGRLDLLRNIVNNWPDAKEQVLESTALRNFDRAGVAAVMLQRLVTTTDRALAGMAFADVQRLTARRQLQRQRCRWEPDPATGSDRTLYPLPSGWITDARNWDGARPRHHGKGMVTCRGDAAAELSSELYWMRSDEYARQVASLRALSRYAGPEFDSQLAALMPSLISLFDELPSVYPNDMNSSTIPSDYDIRARLVRAMMRRGYSPSLDDALLMVRSRPTFPAEAYVDLIATFDDPAALQEVYKVFDTTPNLEHRYSGESMRKWALALGRADREANLDLPALKSRLVQAKNLPYPLGEHLDDAIRTYGTVKKSPIESLLSVGLRYEGNVVVVNRILAEGVDLNQVVRDTTPLIRAAEYFPQHVPAFLEHGAKPDMPDNQGRTPLMAAFMSRKDLDPVPVARLLLDKGANPAATTVFGTTALHYAAARGPEGVVMLLSKGVPVDPLDQNGNSPLFYATTAAAAKALIAAGASVNRENRGGETPLSLAAKSSDRKDVASTLVAHGAMFTPSQVATGVSNVAKSALGVVYFNLVFPFWR